jgi:hypothetical protein
VLAAVWGPWHRIEPLLVDRASVDHADAIDAQLDPAERGPHLIEDLGVGFGEDEVLRSRLVDHRPVAVPRLIVPRLARVRELMPQPEAELTLQLEQSLFVRSMSICCQGIGILNALYLSTKKVLLGE